MNELRFTIKRRHADPADGLELGDLVFSSPQGVISSEGRTPDQGMMIYLAISDLIDGLVSLKEGNVKTFEFIGADSSYRILFQRVRDKVRIYNGKSDLGTATIDDIIDAIKSGILEFLSHPENLLTEGDSALYDLRNSLKRIEINYLTPVWTAAGTEQSGSPSGAAPRVFVQRNFVLLRGNGVG